MTPTDKIKKLRRIYNRTRKNKRGNFVSSDAFYNLEAAIEDIERTGKCDKVSLGTLKRVHGQLGRMARVLWGENTF